MPAEPDAPTQDFSGTTENFIKVDYVEPDNGGSAILGYDLWRDDGAGGLFESLYGLSADRS